MRYTITLPLRSHDKETPTQWAREHCKSYLSVTWYLTEDEGKSEADYHFSDEKDLTMFLLRWS
jgi:hypothetical protein